MLKTDANTRLGPALVTAATGAELELQVEGETVKALNALAMPYMPRVGDIVLAIGQDDGHYVIGVLQTTGDMRLAFPAGVHFHAPRGRVEFTSGEEIELQAPSVRVQSGKLELVARTISEKFVNAFRCVKELSQLRAGRARTMVDGMNYQRAERQAIRARKDVRVDGNQIHLG